MDGAGVGASDETRVRDLTEEQVRAFFLSDRVTLKRSGQRKAEVGIAKTRRILRLALTWAQEVGLIENAPIPSLKSEGAAPETRSHSTGVDEAEEQGSGRTQAAVSRWRSLWSAQ